MRVRQRRSFGFRRFLRQRFEHGRRFGRNRMSGRATGARVAYLLGSPAVPALLLARISTRVLRNGRDLRRFAAALPILTCFALAWTAGEARGYADAAFRSRA